VANSTALNCILVKAVVNQPVTLTKMSAKSSPRFVESPDLKSPLIVRDAALLQVVNPLLSKKRVCTSTINREICATIDHSVEQHIRSSCLVRIERDPHTLGIGYGVASKLSTSSSAAGVEGIGIAELMLINTTETSDV
jgi:hypothetical protein